jgi:CheY-like chemotaxis protein
MSRPRVLIVEDDSDMRRLYALALNQRGFEVKLAANGAEAVERVLSGERPDVIVLDWFLPLMDGAEVLNRLAGDLRGSSIPIVVISGQPCPPEEQLDPRIQCWMTKPVTIEDLVSEIQRPPGGRRGTRETLRDSGTWR